MRYPLLAGNDTGHLQFSWFAFGKERFPGKFPAFIESIRLTLRLKYVRLKLRDMNENFVYNRFQVRTRNKANKFRYHTQRLIIR